MKKNTMIGLALIPCLLWASAFPTIKTLYQLFEIGKDVGIKLYLAGLRFFFAGVVILIYYSIKNRKMPLLSKRKYIGQVILLGMMQTAIMYTFFYIGLYNSTGVKSSILSQASIFAVVILSHFIYKNDQIHRGKIIGLILGLLGIVVVNIGGLKTDGQIFEFNFMGEGFLLIAGVFSTISLFFAKGISQKISPVLMTGWQLTFGGFVLLGMGFITKKQELIWRTPLTVGLFIYSVLLSAGAFTLWFVLVQQYKTGELSMIRFSIPIFGAILSVLFIPNEHLTLSIVVALILVAIGIYQCNRPRI